jgi:hypothetical protein
VSSKSKTVQRALLALMAVFMVPTLLASVGTIVYIYKEEQDRFQESLAEATRALALVVDRELSRREAIIRTLSDSPLLTRGDLEGFHGYAGAVAVGPDSAVILHDLDGRPLLNTRLPLGGPPPNSDTFTQLRARAGPTATVVSDLYLSASSGKPSFAVQVPVVRDGRPVYYLSLTSYASHLQAVLERHQLASDWVVAVLDAQRTVVAAPWSRGTRPPPNTSASRCPSA